MQYGEPVIAVNPPNPPNAPYPHPRNVKPELTSRHEIIKSFLSGEIDEQKYRRDYGYRLQVRSVNSANF